MNVTLFQHISIHPSTKKQPIPPPKFNIAPENWLLGGYFPFGIAYFQGRTVNLRVPQIITTRYISATLWRYQDLHDMWKICPVSLGPFRRPQRKNNEGQIHRGFQKCLVFDRETSFKKNGHELKLEFEMFYQQYSWEPKGTPPMPCKTPKK